VRILVVDDHELVRKGICTALATEPTISVCGEAADGRQAIEQARALQPDVIIMDISMPNLNGIEATREIKRLIPKTEIVIVSQHESPEMIRQALNAGARGYVVKSAISDDLLAAVSKASQQQTFVKSLKSNTTNQSPEPPEDTLRRGATAEKDLRESEVRLRSAVNDMAQGLYTLDSHGLITYLNPSAEDMFGWKSSELLGKNMHEITHYKRIDGASLPASDCRILQAIRNGIELREHSDVFIRKDGSPFPVVLSASPQKINGNVVGIVVNFRDATRFPEAEQGDSQGTSVALHQLVQTLEARIAERTRELQNATDKLRELSGRLLQTQDEERRRIARELHDGVGQLLTALGMNLSSVASEKAKLSLGAVQALDENAELIKQASQEIRTMSHLLHPPLLDEVGLESALRWYIDGFAERSKIAVDIKLVRGFSDGLPRDLALSLFRIVQECLTNVHRHSGSSTAVVGIERSPREITLEVKDDGVGIPAQLQSIISSGSSSGVGLRGMRERIRQFGGRLEVHSSQTGTSIVAVIPIPDIPREAADRTAHDEQPIAIEREETLEPAPVTILCIDDEPAGLLPRKLLLESAGYQVIEARSGLEGVHLFKSEKVDAVILDYWMSGMKGTAVASEMKQIKPSVPIIMLSGMADLPGEVSGLVDQWIVKGSTRAEQLLDSIKALVERKPF
jgi:PAS domain S-box-containing protein